MDIGTLAGRLVLDDALSPGLDTALTKLNKFGQGVQTIGAGLTAAVTLPLAAIGAGSLKAAIDFESSFAGVRKTVDATEPELERLEGAFRQLATEIPISVNELNRIAEAGGQLGVETENIEQFTRTMADMGIATNLSSEQAATGLAQIANIIDNDAGPQYDRLGSTIVELGNKSAATESDIVSFGLRLSAAGKVAGLTEPDILAIGTALASVGIEAEAGGTAFSKVFTQIAQAAAQGGGQLEQFASIAGQSAEEFKASFETDAAGAIVDFVEGLGDIDKAGGNLFQTLEDLGVSEARLRNALLASAGAGDLLRDSINTGRAAWETNNALTKEAETRYKTVASQLTTLYNRIYDVAITLGDALIPTLLDVVKALDPVIDAVASAARWFAELPAPVRTTSAALLGLAAAAGPVIFLAGQMVISIAAIIPLFASGTIGATALSGALGLLTTAGPIIGLMAGLAAALYQVDKAIVDLYQHWQAGGSMWEFFTAKDDNTFLRRWLGLNNELPKVKDNLKALNTEGFGPTLTAEAAINLLNKQLEDSNRALAGQTDNLKKSLEALRTEAAEPLSAMQKTLIAEYHASGKGLEDTAKAAGAGETATRKYIKSLDESNSKIKAQSDALKTLTDRLGGSEAIAAWELWSAALPRVGGAAKLTAESQRELSEITNKALEAYRRMGRQAPPELEAVRRSVAGLASENIRWSVAIPVLTNRFHVATDAAKRFVQPVLDVSRVTGQFDIGLIDAADSLDNMRREAEEATPAVYNLSAALKDVFKNWGDDVGKMLVDAFTGGGGVAGAIKGLATKWGADLGGAIGGAFGPMGEQIGKAVGSLAGPLAEKIADALTDSEAEKLARDVGRSWGISISEELAETLEEQSKQRGRWATTLLNMKDILEEGGGLNPSNVGEMTDKLREMFSVIEMGELTAAEGAQILDDNWSDFVEAGSSGLGVLNRELVEIIRLQRDFGLASEAVGEYLASQGKSAVSGFGTFLKTGADALREYNDAVNDQNELIADRASGDKIAEAAKRVQDAWKTVTATTIESQTVATSMGFALTGTFNAMLDSGMSFRDVMREMAPAINDFSFQLGQLGFTGGAGFEMLQQQVALFSDSVTGPALEGVDGLTQGMVALSNMGILNQETFAGLAEQVGATFTSLIEGGATSEAAMVAMQDPLQRLWELQREFGFAVDDATQALIDQAVEQGVVGERHRSVSDRMLEATNRMAFALEGIARHFGVTIPAAAESGAGRVQNALDGIQTPDLTIDVDWNIPAMPQTDQPTYAATGWEVPRYYGQGGKVVAFEPRATDIIPAMVSPGERILSVAQNQQYEEEQTSNADVVGAIEQMQFSLETKIPRAMERAVKTGLTGLRVAS